MKRPDYSHLNVDDFDYELPEHLIAKTPSPRRDEARLLVCRPGSSDVRHRSIVDLPELLRAGDILVVNNTKVMKARLHLRREETGGQVEILLLEPIDNAEPASPSRRWRAIGRPLRKLKDGEALIEAAGKPVVRVIGRAGGHGDDQETRAQERFVIVEGITESLEDVARRHGEMPLPPYITAKDRPVTEDDEDRYQTVYAKKEGAVAAPTAGLHLTTALIAKLESKEITVAEVTLHVGWGTFSPLEQSQLNGGTLHEERYSVEEATLAMLRAAKAEGRRVICVGTTSLRTIETLASQKEPFTEASGRTDIFIAPGYELRAASGLLTNFHLPKTSLFALVSALLATENAKAVYGQAVEAEYRFFSYGDAMLILS